MRYGIVGGGALGLTLALRLSQRGHKVTVFERAAVPGGLASSFEVVDGIWLERFYHHIFRTDRHVIGLIRELGLGDSLVWHRPVSTVFVNGRARQLDSPGSLLRFADLSVPSRIRTAATLAILKLLPTPGPLERVAAGRWMARVGGREAYELLWQPLLESKFGAAFDRVSMAWLWARLHDRTSELGYLRHGFHTLYEALARAAATAGGRLQFGTDVTGIRPTGAGLEVAWNDGDGHGCTEQFERVVSTLPAHLTQRLVIDGPAVLPAPDAGTLSAQSLIVALDRPLTGIYWVGVADPGAPFLAIVEHTAMMPTSDYGDRTLVYLGAYRESGDLRLRLSTSELLQLACAQMATFNPDFRPSWVTEAWSFTAADAQPIVDVGYRSRIPDPATATPGLFNVSMFHVFPHDRGQNYSIRLAEEVVLHLDASGRQG